MNTADYTPDSICQSLGLPGFQSDPRSLGAAASLRLLLQPSFHPEVCITITMTGEECKVSVVAAREMIWHLSRPKLIFTDKTEALISKECVMLLLADLASATASLKGSGIMIDGMPVDAVEHKDGKVVRLLTHNVSARGAFAELVGRTIQATWTAVDEPYCRNALAKTAKYTGLKLPETLEPERRPIVRTLVLGTTEDRAQVLEALRRRGDA